MLARACLGKRRKRRRPGRFIQELPGRGMLDQHPGEFSIRIDSAECSRYYIHFVMGDPGLRRRVGRATRERALMESSPYVFRQ